MSAIRSLPGVNRTWPETPDTVALTQSGLSLSSTATMCRHRPEHQCGEDSLGDCRRCSRPRTLASSPWPPVRRPRLDPLRTTASYFAFWDAAVEPRRPSLDQTMGWGTAEFVYPTLLVKLPELQVIQPSLNIYRRRALNFTRRNVTVGGFGLLAGTSLSPNARAEFGEVLRDFGEGIEDFVVAQDAYIYGYPLVTMEYTRRIITNVASPEGNRAPMGQFIKSRQYPDASFRDVTAPNADTLYTAAFIDVGKEPWVLSIPDMKDRYFLFPMLDGWTDVFQVPGKRTTGTGAQTYAITGPGWHGALPAGIKEYKSPTSLVWILAVSTAPERLKITQRSIPRRINANWCR